MKVGGQAIAENGYGASESVGAHAVGTAPPDTLKLRRQTAAAVGIKRGRPRCLCLWKHLALKWKKLSTKATQTWAEGVWVGTWCTEQKEAWMKQICEVQTWRQVMGPARAVMRETRDLGIKWPRTLTFEGQVQVDMRYVCPQDVKKMLMKQARSTYWRK